MVLPEIEISPLPKNSGGWGPLPDGNDTKKDNLLTSMPFQEFNKCDRVGRAADWLGTDRYYKRGDGHYRHNERIYGSAANAGQQFDYVHENDDQHFQLVDTSKPQRPNNKPFRRHFHMRRMMQQREQDRQQIANSTQNAKLKRSIIKEHMRVFKMKNRRGGRAGNANTGARRWNDRNHHKNRQYSVQVQPEWTLHDRIELTRLNKHILPNVEGKDIKGHCYGSLHYYDKSVDRITVKNAVNLQVCGGAFCNVSTTDDPVMEQLAQENAGNVFATDTILATLMASNRSVYSWDIIAHRIGDKLFLDKRDSGGFSNPVDALTVSETSVEPPLFDAPGINNARDLATEALYINQNFRRQVLKRTEKAYKFENETILLAENDPAAKNIETAFKYRQFNVGKDFSDNPIRLVCRTEHDAVQTGVNGETQFLTIKGQHAVRRR
ncbi:hypothetical protein L596_002165 [Steinernema carpocapsae]|uniref:Eukaryotic translation initiation factor 3 subunit p66 n=1 Tax=Steinernema carpocapsae TaxID=34508 RepID=A0A4U8UNW5_STECR|nr:hypothetical protein L596_002165 [Steinernema carpocapsae]